MKFAPFLGLLDMMNHYQAETDALNFGLYNMLNATLDQSYHYWSPITDEFKSIPVTQLYRSTYSDNAIPRPPSTKVYTIIGLADAFAIFWSFCLFYGLILDLP